jgi:hypothetical protein
VDASRGIYPHHDVGAARRDHLTAAQQHLRARGRASTRGRQRHHRRSCPGVAEYGDAFTSPHGQPVGSAPSLVDRGFPSSTRQEAGAQSPPPTAAGSLRLRAPRVRSPGPRPWTPSGDSRPRRHRPGGSAGTRHTGAPSGAAGDQHQPGDRPRAQRRWRLAAAASATARPPTVPPTRKPITKAMTRAAMEANHAPPEGNWSHSRSHPTQDGRDRRRPPPGRLRGPPPRRPFRPAAAADRLPGERA